MTDRGIERMLKVIGNRERLSSRTLHQLMGNKSISMPAFDHSSLRSAIVHLGVGAFHRCHQAEYADDLLSQNAGPWSIQAINLRAPDLESTLGEQDGFYCRELRENGSVDRRIIGSIAATHTVLSQEYDPHRLTLETAFQNCLDAQVKVITITVTEKGYCHRPATGEVDWNNLDLQHDLENASKPKSVPGFLLEVIRRRLAAGMLPPTIVCCDNVPDNGSTMRNSVLKLAEKVCPAELADIASKAHFLNSMVDRIVPATRDADIERFASEVGLYDYALVVGEPFRMWVIENPDKAPIPPWDLAGALIVDDVLPYEILKMRVVNGIQSNLCQLGVLANIEFMSDVMNTPEFLAFARQTVEREVAANLPSVPGIDHNEYIELTVRRLCNRDLKHRTAQISTDGSQKIKQRLLQPIRDAIANGQPYDGLALGTAGWIVYTSGKSHDGRSHPVNDPLAGQLSEVHRQSGHATRQLVKDILSIEQVFGTDLKDNEEFKAKLVEFVDALKTQPVLEVLRSFLAGRALRAAE